MIPVTKPFLPPIEEYEALVRGIWSRNHLTNNGPLVQELETRVAAYLGVPAMQYVTNGTIALQLAIKALDLKGEIITTPFSYVATTSTIVWEGCTPVFVDIDPHTFNIDPSLIEAAITPRTSAILATHVFGNPCDVEAIDAIAKKHHLKVIYDGAHAFGTKYKGESIFKWGDISTCSFHATKLFHTVEGGGMFASDSYLLKEIEFLRNFGHDGYDKFHGLGINGKNSEFHAAMGLVHLKYQQEVLSRRRAIVSMYNDGLGDLGVHTLKLDKNAQWNNAYYPIVLDSESQLVSLKSVLESNSIFPRRYFYPSLNTLKYVSDIKMPISESISAQILCLPIYSGLEDSDVKSIISICQNNIRNGFFK